METKLKLSEVIVDNFIIQVDPLDKEKKEQVFLVKKISDVSKKKIYGFFLAELIEDPSLLMEKTVITARIIFNENDDKTSKYFVRPTKERVKKIKEELYNIFESKKSTIKENDVYLLQYIIRNINAVHKHGVIFRDKTEWQKDDCITGCGAKSTQEAVYGKSQVRCCEKPECEERAAERAKIVI